MKVALKAVAIGWSILAIFVGIGWGLARYNVPHAADLALAAGLLTLLIVAFGGGGREDSE